MTCASPWTRGQNFGEFWRRHAKRFRRRFKDGELDIDEWEEAIHRGLAKRVEQLKAEQARRASSKQARAQAKLDAGALDPANAPAYQRGFRATKRLPGKAQRPQSAPRSGRALP